jgi:hypothetical protein
MATVRVALNEAMRALRSAGLGEDATADELAVGLEAAQNLVLEIHEARGPLYDLDVSAAYVAGENQRLRIVNGDVVQITLPNAVAMFWDYDPYDYGFVPGYPGLPPAGSTGAADNIQYRPPADGARIEIVGTTQALYFYRADLNQWTPAYGLTIDAELPFNDRLTSSFTAMLAERLADVLADAPQISPQLARRIAAGRSAIFIQSGRRRSHRRVGEYF